MIMVYVEPDLSAVPAARIIRPADRTASPLLKQEGPIFFLGYATIPEIASSDFCAVFLRIFFSPGYGAGIAAFLAVSYPSALACEEFSSVCRSPAVRTYFPAVL